MTEQKTTDPFEARFAGLVRTYTDEAGARPIDSLAVSRTAMASGRTSGWSTRGLGARVTGRRDSGRWAAAAVAVVLVGVVGIAIWSRSSNSGIGPGPSASAAPSSGASPRASAIGPVPEALRHLWQRPLPVAPGPSWATANMVLTDEVLGVGSDPDTAMHSAVAAAGPDTLVVTATPETTGCAVGDVGVYRWSLEGKDTVVTLGAVGIDACTAREAALTGPWVRADIPQSGETAILSPGSYATTRFDPFGDATTMSLSYRVPGGWKVQDDQVGSFVLHHPSDATTGPASTDKFILMMAQPTVAADFSSGAVCGPFEAAPGIALRSDAILAALVARPGVVATTPAAVTIGGYEGTLVDLSVAPSWTGGCEAQGGTTVGIPIIRGPGSKLGPSIGLSPGAPVRLILVDVADGRTMAIAISCEPASGASSFDEQVAAAMPVIESMELHPPAP